jgi:hypothetical protein
MINAALAMSELAHVALFGAVTIMRTQPGAEPVRGLAVPVSQMSQVQGYVYANGGYSTQNCRQSGKPIKDLGASRAGSSEGDPAPGGACVAGDPQVAVGAEGYALRVRFEPD